MRDIFGGIVFSPDLPDGKAAVEVEFSKSEVNLIRGGDSSRWDLSDVRVEVGGSSNHLIFFIRKDQPQFSFYLPISKELKCALSKLSNKEFELEVAKSLTRQRSAKAFWAFVAIAVFAVCLGAVLFRDQLSRKVVEFIPFKVEEVIGDKLVGVVAPVHSRINDEVALSKLRTLLDPLKRVLPESYQSVSLYISNSPEINAFALPGGQIVFNVGALKAAKTGSEILGVAAHEFARVTERHVMRNVLQGAGIFLVIQTLLGDFTGLIAVVADQGSFLMNQSFSRAMETEADLVGFDYMIKAKIDPRGMSLFFKQIMNQSKLGSETSKKVESALEFLSTHPSTEDRVREIDARYDSLAEETKKELNSDFAGFQELKKYLDSKY